MSNEMAIHGLNERVSKLEKADRVLISEAAILSLQDGDVVVFRLVDGRGFTEETRQGVMAVLQAKIVDFLRERKGIEVRCLVVEAVAEVCVLRKEGADGQEG